MFFFFLVSGTLFSITAGLAVWKYGGSTTANMLQVVPSSYEIRAAILIAALQLCLSSALGHSALFQHLEDQWRVQRCKSFSRRKPRGNPREFIQKQGVPREIRAIIWNSSRGNL